MSSLKITKEWLESILLEKIQSFEVTAGSNAGDGYLSVLYSIEVTFPESQGPNCDKTEQKPPVHLLLKAFPSQSSRQDMLSATNFFHKEVKVYETVLPELIRFQEDHKNVKSDKKIILPFPKFFYGRSIDFTQKSDEKQELNPLENCVVMNDVRKDGGFKLADRLVGLDLEHTRLVIKTQAKLHALSWVYKKVTGTKSINEKFPFLKTTIFDDLDDMIRVMSDSHFRMAQRALENHLDDGDSLKTELINSVQQANIKCHDVYALYFCDTTLPSDPSINKNNILRVPLEKTQQDEVEWFCLIHGDAWLNNQMFCYDEEGSPKDIVLVDLQWTREGNPMTDLTYSIYTNTTSEFRKAHLDQLLQIYYETFNDICDQFGVAPFPGFSLSELKRRFHMAKIFGFAMMILGSPLFLSDPEEAKDMETLETTDMNDILKELVSSNPVETQLRYKLRITDIVKELYEQGVI